MSRFKAVSLLWVALLCLSVMGQHRTDDWYVGDPVGIPVKGVSNKRIGGQGLADTVRMVFTMDPDLDHEDPRYDAAVAAADTVIDLSDAANGFAWCWIDSLNFASSAIDSYTSGNRFVPWVTADCGSQGQGKDITEDSSTSVLMIYFPFEDYIPAGATVDSARMYVKSASSWYRATVDTAAAILMTNPNDDKWYTSTGYDTDLTRYAHASWSWQILGQDRAGAVAGYPATSSDQWVPALSERPRFWDWGDAWTFTGEPDSSNASPILAQTTVGHDLIGPMQAIANGSVNNGIAFVDWDVAGPPQSRLFWGWQQNGAGTRLDRGPWIEVVYTTDSYLDAFPGGKKFAFLFSTDDIRPINSDWVALFDSVGGNYSIYAAENQVGGVDNVPADSLVAWAERGFAVGSHSRSHDPLQDLTNSDTYAGLGDTSLYFRGCELSDLTAGANGVDSLMCETDPFWLYREMADAPTSTRTHAEWAAHPLVGKGFAYPVDTWPDGPAMDALHAHGYLSWRSSGIDRRYLATEEMDHIRPALPIDAGADSARAGRPMQYRGLPYNVRAITQFNESIEQIVGGLADNPTEAEVKENTRMAIRSILARGGDVFSLFTHNSKTTPYGYSNGIDTYELRWVLEEVIANGGWITSHEDYVRWVMKRSTPVGTPPEYNQTEQYRWTADDEVWYEPWPSGHEPPSTSKTATGDDVYAQYGISEAKAYDSNNTVALRFDTDNYPNSMNNWIDSSDTVTLFGVSFDASEGTPDSSTTNQVLYTSSEIDRDYLDNTMTNDLDSGNLTRIIVPANETSWFTYGDVDPDVGVYLGAVDTDDVVSFSPTETSNTNQWSFSQRTTGGFSEEPPPNGLSIDSSTGEITGTPTEIGRFTFWPKSGCSDDCGGSKFVQRVTLDVVAAVASNDTVTISENSDYFTSTSFGSRDNSEPLVWEDFESVSAMSQTEIDTTSPGNDVAPALLDTLGWSGTKAMRTQNGFWNGASHNSTTGRQGVARYFFNGKFNDGAYMASGDKIYTHFWLRPSYGRGYCYDPDTLEVCCDQGTASTNNHQIKLWRFTGNPGDSTGEDPSDQNSWGGSPAIFNLLNAPCGTGKEFSPCRWELWDQYLFDTKDDFGPWFDKQGFDSTSVYPHEEWMAHESLLKASQYDVADGHFQWWIYNSVADGTYDSESVGDWDNPCQTYGHGVSGGNPTEMDFDGFAKIEFGVWADAGGDNSVGAISVRQYWDNIYIDKGWSRVVVTDVEDMSSAKYRDPQPYISWDPAEVKFTANLHSFSAGDTVYVQFVDDENTATLAGRMVVQ